MAYMGYVSPQGTVTTTDNNPGNRKNTNGFVNPKNVGQVLEVASQVYQNLPPDKQAKLKSMASEAKDKATDSIRNAVRQAGNKGRGGGNSNKNNNNPSFGTYALTDAPKPKPISLNTGVQPRTYVSDFMEAVYGSCVPMNITAAKFRFPASTSNTLYNYFTSVIAFDLQTKGQMNVAFALDLTTFSAANILTAMNSLVVALQIYFYYKSIISYHSNPHNRNKGMIFIRQNITVQMIDDLSRLERRLLDTPIPPKMLEFLRYLSGTFYSGETAGSPLIKIVPVSPGSTMVNSNDISNALTDISSDTNSKVYTLMRRCFPHWTPKSLDDVPTDPQYDKNFKTIMANLPFISYVNSATGIYPSVTTDTATVFYNTFTENLDGGAFSLTGMYNTAAADWIPSLIQPITNGGTTSQNNSRWSYYVNSSSTTYQFYPSDVDPVLTRSRQETYQVNDSANAVINVHLSGASFCQNVSGSTIRETTYKVLDYLMSFGDIKVDARNFHHRASGGRK